MSLEIRYEGSSRVLTPEPDIDDDRFWIEDVEGLEGADIEFDISDGFGDGGFLTKARLSKRELVIKGNAVAPLDEEYAVLRARAKIEALAAEWSWQTARWLYVDLPSPGIPVQFKAYKSDKIRLSAPKGRLQPFELPFTCADFRAYHQTPTTVDVPSGGTVAVTNIGNTPTYMTAILSANATNPYLQNDTTGGRFTLSGAMDSGTKVDFLNRKTWNGSGVRAELAAIPRDWIPLLPGVAVLSANAPWAVSFRSAWA